MNYKKTYFDSGNEYARKKGLYAVRDSLPIQGLIKRKSKEHYDLVLKNKWELFDNCQKVLDAGCGRGQFLQHAPNEIKAEGIDIIKEELEQAKKKGLHVGSCDLTKRLPFKDSTFDGIHCSHVLEHLPNGAFTIAEFKRILKPRGILVLAVPNFSFKQFYADYTHVRPYPKEALYRILKDSGFQHIRIINGISTNKLISGLFLLTPNLRYKLEKLFGKLKPWEIIAIAR